MYGKLVRIGNFSAYREVLDRLFKYLFYYYCFRYTYRLFITAEQRFWASLLPQFFLFLFLSTKDIIDLIYI